jgi:hypothetical protein
MRLSVILFFCLISTLLLGQHQEMDRDSTHLNLGSHTNGHAHHKIQVVMSNTHISNGRNAEGEKVWLVLPSWSINYDYKFDDKWQIGLHTDMITNKFEVELEHDMVIVERVRPVALALMGGYKTRSPFTFLVGGGIEFEKNKNLGFIRLGVEPGWHFDSGKWEFSVLLEYDMKFNNYDSWVLGFGIARLF